MTFIKYTNDGKAVIQPAALTLSGLDSEKMLEMHTLENAIVLLKADMTPLETFYAILELDRLGREILSRWASRQETSPVPNGKSGYPGYDTCDNVIPIPVEAFQSAGIWGEDLHVQSANGAVLITADDDTETGDVDD